MLVLNNVSKIYKTNSKTVHALVDVSLQFDSTGLVAIVGESGSGKTTLINCISMIEKPMSGSIKFGDKVLNSMTDAELDNYRNNCISFVFQDYNLSDNITVGQNVGLGATIQGQKTTDDLQESCLRQVGLSGYGDSQINELSGGEQQRVAIARSLAKNTPIIIADEPTGNLDQRNGNEI